MTYRKQWFTNRTLKPEDVIEAIRYFNSHGVTNVTNEDLSMATGYTVKQVQHAIRVGIAQGIIERTIVPVTRHLVAKKGDAA